jgi:MFS family permease
VSERVVYRPLVAWIAVTILVLASVFSYVDRQVVAIVVGPMKADLALSDTQVGWLYGIFALFYAVAGVPIARFADRGNRSRLIAIGLCAWSAMTMLSGLSRNFLQVFAARIGIGVGEATLVPAANSLIGDLFPRERVPFAISVFTTGGVLGSGLAFVIGGSVLALIEHSGQPLLPWLAQLAPWQQFFIYVGLPGFLLAPAILFIREPQRKRVAAKAAGTDLHAVAAFYRENFTTIVLHHLGFLAYALMGFCNVFWTVTFFTRVHGLPASEASSIFGWIFLLAGTWGGPWAAALARRMAARGSQDANIKAAMIGGALMIPSVFLIQLMPTAFWAAVFYVPTMFFSTSPYGLAYGSLPIIAPPQIRATVISVFMFVVSLGMLLGPPLAGTFNEHIFPSQEGVRYSVMSVTALCGGSGFILLWLARKHYAVSLERAVAREAAADAAGPSPEDPT